jgi:hypothetical protein
MGRLLNTFWIFILYLVTLYNWWLYMRWIQGLINPWNMIFTEASGMNIMFNGLINPCIHRNWANHHRVKFCHRLIRCVLTNYFRYTIKLIMADVGQIGVSGEQSRRFLVLIQIWFSHIIKQLMTFNFDEYKDWSAHGTWYSPRMPRWISCSMGWSILVVWRSVGILCSPLVAFCALNIIQLLTLE